ncbi:hypothetical protein, variant [Puccinia triticina 1-1 BBBD Race 1]|uniref:Uncharacterized protein n=1 Tax=Puccinia triticina (isolate 1-1 / race 1 (BBBD)) TaxID=630390 RepID=A0A180H0I6_PUCT1|nr:hypothetical protein, variant [Puccinia triticina 1-1 BBBD Race 1]
MSTHLSDHELGIPQTPDIMLNKPMESSASSYNRHDGQFCVPHRAGPESGYRQYTHVQHDQYQYHQGYRSQQLYNSPVSSSQPSYPPLSDFDNTQNISHLPYSDNNRCSSNFNISFRENPSNSLSGVNPHQYPDLLRNSLLFSAPAQQLAVSNSAPYNHSAIPRPNPASNAAQSTGKNKRKRTNPALAHQLHGSVTTSSDQSLCQTKSTDVGNSEEDVFDSSALPTSPDNHRNDNAENGEPPVASYDIPLPPPDTIGKLSEIFCTPPETMAKFEKLPLYELRKLQSTHIKLHRLNLRIKSEAETLYFEYQKKIQLLSLKFSRPATSIARYLGQNRSRKKNQWNKFKAEDPTAKETFHDSAVELSQQNKDVAVTYKATLPKPPGHAEEEEDSFDPKKKVKSSRNVMKNVRKWRDTVERQLKELSDEGYIEGFLVLASQDHTVNFFSQGGSFIANQFLRNLMDKGDPVGGFHSYAAGTQGRGPPTNQIGLTTQVVSSCKVVPSVEGGTGATVGSSTIVGTSTIVGARKVDGPSVVVAASIESGPPEVGSRSEDVSRSEVGSRLEVGLASKVVNPGVLPSMDVQNTARTTYARRKPAGLKEYSDVCRGSLVKNKKHITEVLGKMFSFSCEWG